MNDLVLVMVGVDGNVWLLVIGDFIFEFLILFKMEWIVWGDGGFVLCVFY